VGSTPRIFTSAGYLLYKAGLYAQKAFDEALSAVGLTAREFLLLSIAATGRLSQQDMARRLAIDPTVVVGVVDELERRRLVERQRDLADRRRYILVVSAAGAEMLNKAERAATDATSAFLGPLSDTQRRQLETLLVTLMSSKMPWLAS
jgi:DNA-binding MarR family transcriptional regulator